MGAHAGGCRCWLGVGGWGTIEWAAAMRVDWGLRRALSVGRRVGEAGVDGRLIMDN